MADLRRQMPVGAMAMRNKPETFKIEDNLEDSKNSRIDTFLSFTD